MKVEILKENLKNALSVVDRVAGKNISLPVLGNVLIKTDETFLELNSTDLETAVRFWVLAKIIKGGAVAVPSKFVSGFISSLPNEKISLETKDQNIHLECKSIKTVIRGQAAEDFPLFPKQKMLRSLRLTLLTFVLD